MSLMLNHRWEHALIAATVEAASRACPNCYLGRTAIQKLLYFMNVLGVPMKYGFEIYHYGPFCSSVMADVDWLLADDVITDTATAERYSNYRPGSAWGELTEDFSDKLAHHRDVIESVVNALGSLSPQDLELVATLDFCFRWVRASTPNGPWKHATITKFKRIKKDKFTDEDIETWYQGLVKARLIEADPSSRESPLGLMTNCS